MTNVFFRCILGIPSLMILLIPTIALSCKNRNLNMTEVMNDFQYVIFQDLQNLLELLDSNIYDSCRKPQKSKPSPCLDGMEIHSVHRLTCSVLYIAKQNNFDFNQEIIILSRNTEKTLKCSCKSQKQSRKNRNRKSKMSTIAKSKTKCPQKKFLRITEKISDINLCWKKIFKFTEI
ncbi:interleukin-7-like [Cetorhinus maximus]